MDNSTKTDVAVLRDLAKAYVDVSRSEEQARRRKLWKDHNSFCFTQPPIYVRWLSAWSEAVESHLQCVDPIYRRYEEHLRQMLFQSTIGDDFVIEPWVVVNAIHILPTEGHWGMSAKWERPAERGGAGRWQPPLVDPDDIEKLASPVHSIDEEATASLEEKVRDAFDGILDVVVSRAPFYRTWTGDISTDLAYLRGIDQLMLDMVDRPQWLHCLASKMRDGILNTHKQAETAGDWKACDGQNQAMPYAQELPEPNSTGQAVLQSSLWGYMAGQEFTLVSPQMHWDFLLEYQLPILERFGLVAYGCCEDLTRKIHLLRRIPNLRRIAVTPFADIRKCADSIGSDYIISWRPSPAEMVCCGWDKEYVVRHTKDALRVMKGLHLDITLKDVQTVQGDTSRLKEWVEAVREACSEVYG